MKFTRTISLILALCMVLTIFTVGIISVSAAENDVAVEAAEVTTVSDWKSRGYFYGKCTTDEMLIFPSDSPSITSSDYNCFPVQVLATNNSRTSYAYLVSFVYSSSKINELTQILGEARGNEFLSSYGIWFDVIIVNVDEDGYSYIDGGTMIDIDDIKTLDAVPEYTDTVITAKDPRDIVPNKFYDSLSSSVKDVLINNSGMKFDAIAELSIKKTDDVIYRFLCYGTDDNSKTNLYVVNVREEGDVAEIIEYAPFELNYYGELEASRQDNTENTSEEQKDVTGETQNATDAIGETMNNTESTKNTQNTNASNSNYSGTSSSTNSGSSASATSPKTGQEETIVFVMLGVMILASAVIFFVRKRERT